MTNIVKTPFHNLIEKTLDNFLEFNYRFDVTEQVKKYIQKWYDLLETIKDQMEREIIEAYISGLEDVDTDNDYPEYYDEFDGQKSDDWLDRNVQIIDEIEMCNIDY